MLRYTRNKLKNLIKKAKRSFMITAFSSRRPKKVWRTIHLGGSNDSVSVCVQAADGSNHFLQVHQGEVRCVDLCIKQRLDVS